MRPWVDPLSPSLSSVYIGSLPDIKLRRLLCQNSQRKQRTMMTGKEMVVQVHESKGNEREGEQGEQVQIQEDWGPKESW